MKFWPKKKTKRELLTEKTDLSMVLANAMDSLDYGECNEKSIGTALYIVLKEAGYEEVDACASAILVSKDFAVPFRKSYWKENSNANRMATLAVAIKKGAERIEQGIDDDTRRNTAGALESAQQELSRTPAHKEVRKQPKN